MIYALIFTAAAIAARLYGTIEFARANKPASNTAELPVGAPTWTSFAGGL